MTNQILEASRSKSEKVNMSNMQPFKIGVPDSSLIDLQERLSRTRFPDEINDANWGWGTDQKYLHEILEYWRDGFNWRDQEEKINAFPQFIATIDGVDIHFIHARGKGPSPIPLVLTHGWPGSVAEMLDIIPLLTGEKKNSVGNTPQTFDVIVPSLPGFGFSSRATAPGMSSAVIAELWHKLMLQLGYSKFGVQGGDLGSGISLRIALEHPDSVIGAHVNYLSFGYKSVRTSSGDAGDAAGADYDQRRAAWSIAEGGYAHVHATRPQTLGFALNDSPAGLAAWLLEKFHSWSDRSQSAGMMPFAFDELLTNISIYWFTQTITSSMRLYKEGSANPLVLSEDHKIIRPLAIANFPCEIPSQPKERIQKVANLVRWTDMPRGGHFAALEEPELLAADISEFFFSLK